MPQNSYEVCVRAVFTNNLVLRAGFKFNDRHLTWLTPSKARGALTKTVLEAHQPHNTKRPKTSEETMILRQRSGSYVADVDPTAFAEEIKKAIKMMPPIWKVEDLPTRLAKTLREVCRAYEMEIMVNRVRQNNNALT